MKPSFDDMVLLQCLVVSADASSNQTCRKTLFIHKTICCLQRNWSFLCSVISQGKVVALDRWGEKWNHLSMTHRLTTTNYAKNYCNRSCIVKVIVENVVTCFLGHGVQVDLLMLSHFNIISKRLKLNTPLKLFHIFNSPVTLVFKTTPSSQNSEGIIHNEGVYVASLCITLHQEFLTWSKQTPQGPQETLKQGWWCRRNIKMLCRITGCICISKAARDTGRHGYYALWYWSIEWRGIRWPCMAVKGNFCDWKPLDDQYRDKYCMYRPPNCTANDCDLFLPYHIFWCIHTRKTLLSSFDVMYIFIHKYVIIYTSLFSTKAET